MTNYGPHFNVHVLREATKVLAVRYPSMTLSRINELLGKIVESSTHPEVNLALVTTQELLDLIEAAMEGKE